MGKRQKRKSAVGRDNDARGRHLHGEAKENGLDDAEVVGEPRDSHKQNTIQYGRTRLSDFEFAGNAESCHDSRHDSNTAESRCRGDGTESRRIVAIPGTGLFVDEG